MDKQRAAMVRKAFGDRMREIRRKKGIAQERLALESGLNRGYVGRVERGEQNISLVNICRIANALREPPSTLLEWTEDGAGQHPETKSAGEGSVLQLRLGDMLGRMNETMLAEMSGMLRDAFAEGERQDRSRHGGSEPEDSGQPDGPSAKRDGPTRAS